jgi:hypothetical protein
MCLSTVYIQSEDRMIPQIKRILYATDLSPNAVEVHNLNNELSIRCETNLLLRNMNSGDQLQWNRPKS